MENLRIFLIKFINQIFLYFTVFYTNQHQVTNQQVHNCAILMAVRTCINVMFCLSEINENNGSMKCLPWHISKSILLKLFKKFDGINNEAKLKKYDKLIARSKKSELLNKLIYQNYTSQVYQPVSSPGLFYAFRNNCIHS